MRVCVGRTASSAQSTKTSFVKSDCIFFHYLSCATNVFIQLNYSSTHISNYTENNIRFSQEFSWICTARNLFWVKCFLLFLWGMWCEESRQLSGLWGNTSILCCQDGDHRFSALSVCACFYYYYCYYFVIPAAPAVWDNASLNYILPLSTDSRNQTLAVVAPVQLSVCLYLDNSVDKAV